MPLELAWQPSLIDGGAAAFNASYDGLRRITLAGWSVDGDGARPRLVT